MRLRLQTLAAVLAVAAMAPSAALAQAMSVPIDQGARVSLPAGTQTVMVGNPAIADVSVLDSHNAMIMGRTYGVTNLMVIDGRGRTLMDRQIVVSAAEIGRMTAYRGGVNGVHTENYACSPRCERTPMPGENQNDYQNYGAGYNDYEKRAAEARKNGANARADP
jgi:hypothetical protein